MKMIAKAAMVAGLITLGACTDTPAENAAENIRESAENTSDALEEAADNASTENASDALENKADAVEANES